MSCRLNKMLINWLLGFGSKQHENIMPLCYKKIYLVFTFACICFMLKIFFYKILLLTNTFPTPVVLLRARGPPFENYCLLVNIWLTICWLLFQLVLVCSSDAINYTVFLSVLSFHVTCSGSVSGGTVLQTPYVVRCQLWACVINHLLVCSLLMRKYKTKAFG